MPMPSPPVVWSIAGSDSGGGAGLQADLRAFAAFDVHGCTAVAAITAQNSVAIRRIDAVTPALLDAQLAALAEDMPPCVIKTGMLGSVENVRVLRAWLQRLRARGPLALVVDPIWKASSGAILADAAYRNALRELLLPLTTLLTPNRAEAAWLLELSEPLESSAIPEAAHRLLQFGSGAVAITGGDAGGALALDYLHTPQTTGWLMLPRLLTRHGHGSGCTFAAAAAAAMALGYCEADALVLAKMATHDALRHAYAVGAGPGPVLLLPGFTLTPDVLPMLWQYPRAPTLRFPALPDPHIGLYPVVDDPTWIPRCAAAGVTTLQLRIKQPASAELDDAIQTGIALARAHGVHLFINDHWPLAIRHGAWGVHLGQEDLQHADLAAIAGAGLRLGISTHSVWEVARAYAVKPSYYACGPIFPTRSKAMPWHPQGLTNLAFWSALLPAPVVAIGGLDPERAAHAIGCGASGAAVMGGVTAAVDPDQALRDYLAAIPRAPHPRTPPRFPRPTLSWHAAAPADD